jgi:hypothetical protein
MDEVQKPRNSEYDLSSKYVYNVVILERNLSKFYFVSKLKYSLCYSAVKVTSKKFYINTSELLIRKYKSFTFWKFLIGDVT